jgi:hypothetical protein
MQPLWSIGEELYRRGMTASPETRRLIWAAAGLPDGRPATGWRSARTNAAAVERVDDAARLTDMTSEERNTPERQQQLEAEKELFYDAKFALRALLGWPPQGRPGR